MHFWWQETSIVSHFLILSSFPFLLALPPGSSNQNQINCTLSASFRFPHVCIQNDKKIKRSVGMKLRKCHFWDVIMFNNTEVEVFGTGGGGQGFWSRDVMLFVMSLYLNTWTDSYRLWLVFSMMSLRCGQWMPFTGYSKHDIETPAVYFSFF